MKFKSTYVMGALLLIGIASVYLVDYKPTEEKKVKEELSKKLLLIDFDEVIGIDLRNEFGAVSFAKPLNGLFSITSPIIADGDKFVIDGMLRAVKNVKKVREISTGINANLLPYGLETPLTELTFLLSDSSLSGISLGGESPTGEFIFASALGDDKIYTIPKAVFSQTNKNLFELREKKLLNFRRDEMGKITVSTAEFKYEINRLGNGFLMMFPVTVNLDVNKVNAMLSRVSNERAKKFVDTEIPPSSVTGLAEKETSISMIGSNPPRQFELIIGNKVKEDGKWYRYAKDASKPTIFLIDSSFAEFIERDPFELMKKEVLNFDKKKVDAFDIYYGNTGIRLSKNEDEWIVTQPDEFIADEKKVTRLLNKFLSLKASGIEKYDDKNFADYTDGISELTITLYQDSVKANSIRVGRTTGNESFLVSSGSAPIYRVSNSSIEELKVSSDYFKPEED